MRMFAALLLALSLCPSALAGADAVIPAERGDIEVHPISHATFALTWIDVTIFVDPVGGAAAFAAFGVPDLVLITDIHGDHMDAETLGAVAEAQTRVVAPAAVAEQLGAAWEGRTAVLANGESVEIHGVEIEAIPMYNLAEERQRFHEKGRGNGYVLTLGGKRLYVSGDTEDIPEMRALKNIDAAFVCMNLPYTMTVESAADAVLEFAPTIVFPYHYRGQQGMSDVGRFAELVAQNPAIGVRQLDWYAR